MKNKTIKTGLIKLFAVLLSVMTAFALTPAAFAAEGGSESAAPETTDPLIELYKPADGSPATLLLDTTRSTVSTVYAEQGKGSIVVPIASSNPQASVDNVLMSITNASELPFDVTASAQLANVSQSGAALLYNAVLSPLTKPGRYPVTISGSYTSTYCKYTYNSGMSIYEPIYVTTEPLTCTLTVYVEVVNPTYDSYMSGNAISITETETPEYVSTGDKLTVRAKFKNNFGFNMNNVTFKLDAGSFVYDNDTNTKTIPLASGKSETVSWQLIAPTIETTGVTQLSITAEYADDAGQTVSKTFYIALNTYSEKAEDPSKPKAEVIIDDFTAPESVKAGSEFTASVTVTNPSETDAAKVTVEVTNDGTMKKASTNPVVLTDSLKAGETKTLDFTFAVQKDAENGYVNLTASAVVDGSENTKIATTGVGVIAVEPAKVSVVSNDISGGSVNAKLTLTVVLQNDSSETAAENVTVDFSAPAGIDGRSANKIIVDRIEPGKTATVSYEMYVTDGIETGNKYRTITYTVGEVQYSAGTIINNPEKKTDDPSGDPEKESPTIILNTYDFGGDAVFAGKNFTLTFELLNTSPSTTIKNMKIVISSGAETSGVVFTPVSSSNTFFVESLGPKETVSKTIDLNVRSDAEPKSSSIVIEISSDNGKNDSETITIPVKQEIRFNMNTPSSIGTISMQDEGYLGVSCSNMGKSNIYNVKIIISGEGFTASETEYFAGNMNPGQSLSHEFYITPQMAGELGGNITYEYEDAQGNISSETQEIAFSVIESYDDIWGGGDVPMEEFPDDMPVDGEPAEGGIKSWIWYAAGGGVLAVAAVITVAVIVRKRKNADEDEDY